MALTMRPTGLASGIDQDRADYTVFCGEWNIGRIYEVRGGPEHGGRTGEGADDHAHPADEIKGDFIVTGPDVEPSNASPAARPETGAPSTIRHRRLKRSAAAVSGKRGSGLPIADARAGGKARDGEFA